MPTREVRLGIVLYGGVSLAIYENGVTQELYRAIRGDGMYGLIQELIDSRLVVDIISGTSAGGVNGIMLGFALANQRQFAPSADLWRNQGDINALLRSETDSATSSILNSSYYQEKLQECFAESLIRDPNQSAIDELDLFITGTDANGEKYTIYDDQGHALDVKNHRALFKLKYRKEGRVNDFADASPADLAKLARLTSCFPVAFEPVPIKASDTNFFKWGKLKGPAVYLDGGILNNKPFTSTIDAIFRRTATCDVERFLIYVEPDPEFLRRLQRPATRIPQPSPKRDSARWFQFRDIKASRPICKRLRSTTKLPEEFVRFWTSCRPRRLPMRSAWTRPGCSSITNPDAMIPLTLPRA